MYIGVLAALTVSLALPGLSTAGVNAPEVRSLQATMAVSGPVRTAFLVVAGQIPCVGTLRVSCEGGRVDPAQVQIRLPAGGSRIVPISAELASGRLGGAIHARMGASSAHIGLTAGVDLSTVQWRRRFVAMGTGGADLAAPDLDDSAWEVLVPPSMWEENRDAWCRARFKTPSAWPRQPLTITMGAVDDDDVTYLNGIEIGRTAGWDRVRRYVAPAHLVRQGAENVLTVMVRNPAFGGGLSRAPFLATVGPTPVAGTSPTARRRRPTPGRIGSPLPLRSLRVIDGVLRYPDGTEVALWGVNYYPQSWHQFDNMRRLGIDMKATIRADLDHMRAMGIEAIRIHVFDREISDGHGRVIPNEHLDLLQYVIAQAADRRIYMMLTPIAWWGGPNQRPDSFSANSSKPAMLFRPEAVAAAERYLGEFLSQRSPYTGRRLVDEPNLCALEVQNEPSYFGYGDLFGASYNQQGEPPEQLARDRELFRQQWVKWTAMLGLPAGPAAFRLFRYQLMSDYIRRMTAAIRRTGARQPVAISSVGLDGDDLAQAVADSACDAVTFSNYPGGWSQVNDGRDLLPSVAALVVDPRFASKARIAYEFDTPATNRSCYLYPALAAHFRAGDVQIACQFQYDSISTARWNLDWNAHWLNWLYTPTKAASFIAAAGAFHTLPRGVGYPSPSGELRIGPMTASFTRNTSLFDTPECYVQARGESGAPRARPLPVRVVAVGNSPFALYDGTGIYTLRRLGPRRLRLTVNPDATLVGNSLTSGIGAPAAELTFTKRTFALRSPGWDHATCRRSGNLIAPVAPGAWALTPGDYVIER